MTDTLLILWGGLATLAVLCGWGHAWSYRYERDAQARLIEALDDGQRFYQ